MFTELRKYRFVLCAALLICLLCGCGRKTSASPEELAKICGTWVKTSGDMTTTYVINSDGTYSDTAVTTGDFPLKLTLEGTYAYDGKKISFTQEDGLEYSFGVSFEGDTLIFDNDGYQSYYAKK